MNLKQIWYKLKIKIMKFFEKFTSLFKREQKDAKLEDIKDRVYSDNTSIIDSTVLDSSTEELEKAKKAKIEIESKSVTDADREALAELNTHSIGHLIGVHKKIF
jgi:hypothetical protein